MRARVLECSARLRHRGPDWSGVHVHNNNFLAHERLAIVDPASGHQPLYNETKEIIVTVNGEIYNHEALKKSLKQKHSFSTESDCEVIAHLYEEHGEEPVQELDGIFAFVLLDTREWYEEHGEELVQELDGILAFVLLDTRDNSFLAACEPAQQHQKRGEDLYEEHGEELVQELDGIFAFVLLDTRDNSFIAARDPIGVCSMYIGWGRDGSVWFASEMKALKDECERFEIFPPGKIYSSKQSEWREQAPPMRQWYNPKWFDEHIPDTPYDPLVLRAAFEKAVTKRLMTGRAVRGGDKEADDGRAVRRAAVGGLDSSLVASVAKRHLSETRAGEQWGPHLHSYCVGMEGSPDLKAAKEVADYIGTVHHELHFTVQEGIDAISDVIYHIETYDVTTIRASTPMFLMSRKIKALGVKMVLSGEGSDEVFGGYLYFHKAPNKKEFHEETCRKYSSPFTPPLIQLKALHQFDCLHANKATMAWGCRPGARQAVLVSSTFLILFPLPTLLPFPPFHLLQLKALHQFDCLRANKATMAWGLEARVPFLDKEFLETAMSIDPEAKMIKPKEGRIEKYIIRKAFDDPENPYLPHHILYRQKEQFSDGVGYSQSSSHALFPSCQGAFSDGVGYSWMSDASPSSLPLTPHLLAIPILVWSTSSTHILYRQKEQFSDGVGYSWIDGLKAHAENMVSDQMLANAPNMFPINTPQTKEAFFYRMTFEKHFPQVTPSPAVCSLDGAMGKECSVQHMRLQFTWDAAWANNIDPSGRAALGVQ
ncbi:unnamed protein product [Closterium sp. NIES-64]|nr:unnamed protein product [Closterium sp. NIES-64]